MRGGKRTGENSQLQSQGLQAQGHSSRGRDVAQWLKGVCPAIMRTSIWIPTPMSKLDTKRENLNNTLENNKRKETENKKVYIQPPVTNKHHREGKREKQKKKKAPSIARGYCSEVPLPVWSGPLPLWPTHSQARSSATVAFHIGCLLYLGLPVWEQRLWRQAII